LLTIELAGWRKTLVAEGNRMPGDVHEQLSLSIVGFKMPLNLAFDPLF